MIIHTNPDTKTYLTSDILINMDSGKGDNKAEDRSKGEHNPSPDDKMLLDLLKQRIDLQKQQLQETKAIRQAVEKMEKKKSGLFF